MIFGQFWKSADGNVTLDGKPIQDGSRIQGASLLLLGENDLYKAFKAKVKGRYSNLRLANTAQCNKEHKKNLVAQFTINPRPAPTKLNDSS